MTEEKAAKIKALSEAYTRKRQHFDMLGLSNTYGKSQEELVAMAQEAHLAEAEMLEAYAVLKAAQQP